MDTSFPTGMIACMYYRLKPDVAGGFGEMTELDTSTNPATVHRLHYEFEGWLGDCLVGNFAVSILEENVAREFVARGFTGFELREAIISRSDVFDQLQPEVDLPKFVWLKVIGKPGIDDLGIQQSGSLVVSEAVLSTLRQHGLDNCDIKVYHGEP
jgi:hypothetical protein